MYFRLCNMYPKACNIYPKLWDKKFSPTKKHFCPHPSRFYINKVGMLNVR